MSFKNSFLKLHSVIGYQQSEQDGDEIFIKYKGKRIAPVSSKYFKPGTDPIQLNVEIELNENDKWVELELWEYNFILPNTCLGHFRLLVDQGSDTFTAELIKKNSLAKYVLTWEVISRLVKNYNAA